MIDVPVPPLATQTILESYLQVLEVRPSHARFLISLTVHQAAGQRDLIAMYASALGDNAVERYAMFLTSLELSVDVGERRLALTRARDHGLHMDRVAIATAERSIEKAFEVNDLCTSRDLHHNILPQILPRFKGPIPSIIALQPPPSDPELLLLRSIEWTTFMESTYETALEQANVILRYFLGKLLSFCGQWPCLRREYVVRRREGSGCEVATRYAATGTRVFQ
jgi:nuclear pore complex protein Nup107